MQITDFADGSVWAIEPAAMDRILPEVRQMARSWDAAEARVQMKAEDEYEPELSVVDGVAVIPVSGTIRPQGGLFSFLFGGAAINRIRADIAAAADDARVRAMVLNIDSPGGQVAGVSGLAHYVRGVSAKKPVVSYSDGQITSAATWIGSAADRKIISKTTRDGSIGVLQLHADWSKHDAEMGITYTWLAAGKYKALGNPDEPLSAEAKQILEGRLAAVYDVFISDMARFRGVSAETVRTDMAEGRIFIGQQSVDAGLADDTGFLEDAIEAAAVLAGRRQRGAWAPGWAAQTKSTTQEGDDTMWKLSDIKTVDDLKAALPELAGEIETRAADAAKEGVDLAGARTEGATAESERIMGLVKAHFGEAAHGKFAKIVAQEGMDAARYEDLLSAMGIEAPGAPAPAAGADGGGEDADAAFKRQMLDGINGASAGDPGAGDGTGQGPQSWDEAVSAIMAEDKCSRTAAIKKAYAQYPALHQAYIKSVNERKTG